MSIGTPDTGDNNPFAAGRIARTMLLMFLCVMVFYVVGQFLHEIPGVGNNLRSLLERLFTPAPFDPNRNRNPPPAPDGRAGNPTVPAAEKDGAQIQKAFLGNGGLVTVAQAQEVVTMLVRMERAIEGLPEEERTKARDERDKLARELFRARMKAYLAAPPAKRRAELDRQIGQDEVMRRAWKASRTKAAGEGFPGGGGWPGDGGPGGSEEDQSRHLKNFLDSTSPEQRARYEEYRRAMEARRQQLRLPP